jgi:hypothetical protein
VSLANPGGGTCRLDGTSATKRRARVAEASTDESGRWAIRPDGSDVDADHATIAPTAIAGRGKGIAERRGTVGRKLQHLRSLALRPTAALSSICGA